MTSLLRRWRRFRLLPRTAFWRTTVVILLVISASQFLAFLFFLVFFPHGPVPLMVSRPAARVSRARILKPLI